MLEYAKRFWWKLHRLFSPPESCPSRFKPVVMKAKYRFFLHFLSTSASVQTSYKLHTFLTTCLAHVVEPSLHSGYEDSSERVVRRSDTGDARVKGRLSHLRTARLCRTFSVEQRRSQQCPGWSGGAYSIGSAHAFHVIRRVLGVHWANP